MMNKKSGKRILSWLLAAAMLIALMPANALAEPPTESSGSTETTVEFRCPDSEGSAEVSVGDYDSSTTAEALFKDVSSDVLSFDADSAEDSLKEGTIEGTDTPVRLDKAVVLEDGNVPETQEELEQEGTEISAVIKTDNDIAYLPATGGKPVDLGEDQTLVIIYTPEEETPDADADNQGEETKDTPAQETPATDETTDETPANEPAQEVPTNEVISEEPTEEVNADDIAAIIGVPVLLDVPIAKRYPIYVYGYLVNGNKSADESLGANTRIIKDSGTEKSFASNGYANYFTFGKIENATKVDPTSRNATAETFTDAALNTMLSNTFGANTDSKNKLFNWNDVATDGWKIKVADGATDYKEEAPNGKNTWHMDGKINVYKIQYKNGTGRGSDVSKAAGVKNAYYCGTYTITDYVPDPPDGYTKDDFAGWKVKGDNQTGDGTLCTKGEILTLKEFGNAETIILTALWKKAETPTPTGDTPVYVYGNFKHGSTTLSENAALYINDKEDPIEWNGDASKGEYYITFGKLENATDKKPADYTKYSSSAVPVSEISIDNIKTMIADGKVDLANKDTKGSAVKNTLITDSKEVNNLVNGNWSGLKPREGAEGYDDTEHIWTWHIDGTINIYRVYYDKGAIREDVTLPSESTYFLGDYTVRNQEPSSKNYEFTGWKLKGDKTDTIYKSGDTIETNDKDITLVAQWERKPATVTLNIVNGTWKDGTTTTTISVPLTDSKGTLFSDDVKKILEGIIAKEGYETPGTWDRKPNFEPNGIRKDETYTYTLKEAPKVYTVIYQWEGEHPNIAPPTPNPNTTTEPDKITASPSTYTPIPGKNATGKEGTWTFDGWKLPVQDDDARTVTFTGTWTFTPMNFRVVYVWADDFAPSDVSLDSYNKDETYTGTLAEFNVNEAPKTFSTNDNEKGTWTFDGWNAESDIVTSDNLTTITFTGSWTRTKYQVTYTWDGDDGVPSDVKKPTDKVYNTEEAARAAINTVTAKKFTSNMPNGNTAGIWTLSDWQEASSNAKVGHEATVTITLTSTWTFDAKQYKVAYDWNSSDGVPEGVTLPTDGNSYDSVEKANKAMDKVYYEGYTSYADKDSQKGLWTFSGWKASDPVDATDGSNTATITFKGSWKFIKAVVPPTNPFKATLTFKIENGTWLAPYVKDGKTNTDDILVRLTSEKTNSCAMPAGTSLPDGVPLDNYENGQWYRLEADGTTRTLIPNNKMKDEVITRDVTYILVFTAKQPEVDPDTILDVLNHKVTIEKFFEARYNRSTSGTFTVAVDVTVRRDYEVQAIETNYEPIGIFKGDVTLNTGETKRFSFTGENVSLEANTEYTIVVKEEASHQSYVTDDDTVYTITFTTDADGKVIADSILIQANDGDATTNTTITFHNIYTYKRHHSSDDGDNGGKKEENPTVEITDDEALGLNNTDHFAYIVGYGNGEVRPQNSITRAEVAAIFFRLLEDDVRDANYTRQNKFTDVSNDAWYCSAVSTLSAMGIISGYPDATFRPNASITRAEFAAIATRFDVNGDKTPVSFSDIAGHWAKDEIAVAANNGWVNGYEDGSFRPQNKITRAETMSLVNRVLNRRPETAEDLLENMTKWTDNADTNAWYYLAVQEATNSHYYEYKENSQYEKWTELRETRDWSELDK